jgi:predicted PurR-regulated permease PerM
MSFEQFNIAGIYWPPFLLSLIIAIVIFLILRWLMVRFRLHRHVWHPALFEVSLFVCIVSGLVLWLNP